MKLFIKILRFSLKQNLFGSILKGILLLMKEYFF